MAQFEISFVITGLGDMEQDIPQCAYDTNIEYYSYDGDMTLKKGENHIFISQIPLIDLFQSFVNAYRAVPIWTSEFRFSHYFREAESGLKMGGGGIVIFHYEISALALESGSRELQVDLLEFGLELGRACKEFLRAVQTKTPRILELARQDPTLWNRLPLFSFGGFVNSAAQKRGASAS